MRRRGRWVSGGDEEHWLKWPTTHQIGLHQASYPHVHPRQALHQSWSPLRLRYSLQISFFGTLFFKMLQFLWLLNWIGFLHVINDFNRYPYGENILGFSRIWHRDTPNFITCFEWLRRWVVDTFCSLLFTWTHHSQSTISLFVLFVVLSKIYP